MGCTSLSSVRVKTPAGVMALRNPDEFVPTDCVSTQFCSVVRFVVVVPGLSGSPVHEMRGACDNSELISPVGIQLRFASSNWASMPAVACSPAARPGFPFLARSRISSSLYGFARAQLGRHNPIARNTVAEKYCFIMVSRRVFRV